MPSVLLALLMLGQTLELDPPAIAPTKVAIRYTVRFDIDNDQVCAQAQVCDCAVTWEGTGKLLSTQAGSLLYLAAILMVISLVTNVIAQLIVRKFEKQRRAA